MADFYEQARAPRLILALNSTPVRHTNDSVGTDKWAVEGLLKYIWQRLRETSPPGLQDSWLGQDGWRGTLPEDSSSGLTQAQQVEERWATVVTEMLMGVLYSSPGQAYMDDYKKDHLFFEKMAPTPFPSAGVPYPLTAACQQLCTIALISRGYTSQHYGAGVNAGGSNGLPLYQSGGGRWVNNAAWLNPDEALKQPPPDGVAPGAVYEWTPATGPNTDGSHIAFVLRAHRPGAGQGSWNGIQFFDTGGVAIPNRASGVTVRTDGKGNYDDPWAVQPFSGPAAFTGIGILPVSSPQAPDLQTAVNHMRMAWPLGFARILVRLRAGNQLLYASPLLSMCTANSSCNFSIARYLWSLREMPGRKDLDVRWQVSIPAGRLADTMLNASRATQLSTMLQSIQVSISPDRPLGGDPDPKHAGQALIKSLVELSVDPAGQVHLLSQLAQRAESLAWGSESGALAPPAANCLQVYPHYYKGVVITA